MHLLLIVTWGTQSLVIMNTNEQQQSLAKDGCDSFIIEMGKDGKI